MRPAPQALQELLPVDGSPNLCGQGHGQGHASILGSRSLVWADEAACAEHAASLASKPALGNAFIALHGTLGAGKTTWVRHLLRALGVQGRIKSPTFAVLEPYELAQMQVSHFDFYRFESPREWLDAGFREHFEAPGLKLVEWPAKAAPLLPAADLDVFINMQAGETRHVTLQAHSACGLALLA